MSNLATKLWAIFARGVRDPHGSHTSHLKETRDLPLSLLLHDFEEDNVKKGASGESLEDHKGVTSMVLASLQNIEGGENHLFDGHPHCHPDRGNATEDSHVEQGYDREDFRAGPVETHSSRDDPLMGGKGEKEEIDTACCSTHLHKMGKIFPIRQSYPQSNALKKVVDGKSEDDEEATSGRLDALLHWDRNVVAVAVRVTLARDVPSSEEYALLYSLT